MEKSTGAAEARPPRHWRLAALPVLVVALLSAGGAVRPAAAAQDPPPDPFFGTWSDQQTQTEASRSDSQSTLQAQRDAGLGFIRQYVFWDRIETSPGTYNWGYFDNLVTDATARGLQILPTLLNTPAFYTTKPADAKGLYPPDDPNKLARFADAMVHRYGTNGTFFGCTQLPPLPRVCNKPYQPITYWEVWNEADHPAWWKGSPNAAEYLDLLKTVTAAIRKADPAAKVVLGAMTNAGGGTDGGFLDQLYDLGAKDYFDLLSLNPYGRDVGAMVAYLRGEREVATRHGDAAKPIFITEYGWATGGKSDVTVVDSRCQGALLYAGTKRLRELRGELNIHAAAQFQWHDVKTTTTAWPHFAGVIDPDGNAKPSLAPFKAAVAGQPAPAGMTLAEACPPDRQSVDGSLQLLKVFKTGLGTVTSRPSGVACGTDCQQQFAPGTLVTLTAVPDDNSRFAGWTGATCSGTTCTVTMDQARDIGAAFEPVATPGTYQENSPLVSLSGKWASSSSTRDFGGRVSFATNAPGRATLTFKGTSVRWVTRMARSNGISRVEIDGTRVATVDAYSRTTQYRVRVFDSGPLPFGEHTVSISYTGRKRAAATNNNIILDAFIVR